MEVPFRLKAAECYESYCLIRGGSTDSNKRKTHFACSRFTGKTKK
jgi:hypothetical protein